MYHVGKKLLLICLLIPFLIMGCSKRDPNPELSDPIYLDLKNTVGDLQRDVGSFEAGVEEEEKNKENAEPRTKDMSLAKKRLAEARVKLARAKQNLKYYEIRLERRRLEVRLAYEKALAADKPWPDPTEYKAYLANKDLKNAKMSWSTRVPKLKDRIEQYNSQQAPKKSSGSSGGH